MTRFLIGLVDEQERTVTAAGYHLDEGHFHFTDELGDGVFCVSAAAVTGIEPLPDPEHQPQVSGTGGRSGPDSDVLVLRVWSEPGHVEPLRARITSDAQEGAGGPVTTYAAGAEQVLAMVGRWLDGLSRR